MAQKAKIQLMKLLTPLMKALRRRLLTPDASRVAYGVRRHVDTPPIDNTTRDAPSMTQASMKVPRVHSRAEAPPVARDGHSMQGVHNSSSNKSNLVNKTNDSEHDKRS